MNTVLFANDKDIKETETFKERWNQRVSRIQIEGIRKQTLKYPVRGRRNVERDVPMPGLDRIT